jgi:hypothetical protein
MGNDDPRKEVPMIAELLDRAEDVVLRMPVLRDWTWADLQHTPADRRRYGIIDGSLHVSASATPRHQLVASQVGGLLRTAVPDELLVLAYREVASVRAGESLAVDVPLPVELRPAELAGPRRRG